jgi:hypothetical protein
MIMSDLLHKSLRELLSAMDDPRRDIFLQIYDDYQDLFHVAAGSAWNHQAWHGGYADHIAECLRINEATYDTLDAIRKLEFSKASAAIVLFLHDIEKPFRYGPETDARCAVWQNKISDRNNPEAWEDMKWEIIAFLEDKYGFTLSDEEINGLTYTHGEGSHHKKDERVASPLAAHVHHCDNTSARIWHHKGRGLSFKPM